MLTQYKKHILHVSKALNALLLLAVMGLLLANVLLTAGLIYAVRQHTVTVIPPRLQQPVTVSNHSVDDAYLQQMAEYFLYLKLNITPETVGRQYTQLLRYVDPTSYHEIQPRLLQEAKRIQQQKISSNFVVSAVAIASATKQVKLQGTLKKWVGSRPLAPEPSTYLITMAYNNVLTIVGIQHEASTSSSAASP